MATSMTEAGLKELGIADRTESSLDIVGDQERSLLPNFVLDPPNPSDDAPVSQKSTFPREEVKEEEREGPSDSVQTSNFSLFERNEQAKSTRREDASEGPVHQRAPASTHTSSTRSPAGENIESPQASSYHTLEMDSSRLQSNDNQPSTRTPASVRRFFTRRIPIPTSLAALSLLANLGLLLAVILISTIGKDDNAGTSPSPKVPPSSILNTKSSILSRGTLNCGVGEALKGFSLYNKATKRWEGFEVDLCRAIAATIFEDDGENVNFVQLGTGDRFTALQRNDVDVLAAFATFTMQRDVFEPTANAGFTFSTPYLYNGLSFAGQPEYVACAEVQNTTGNCSGVKICVQTNTTHVEILQKLVPSNSIVEAPTLKDFYLLFVNGPCNVLAGEQFELSQTIVTQAGYRRNYTVSEKQFSKEPIALVTRDDDPDWSSLVNWVLLGLIAAEHATIFQSAAELTVANPPPTLNEEFKFRRAIAKVGNYKEMYQRNLESLVPRASVNMLNNGSSPLLYSIPFGEANITGPEPKSGGTLDRILQRGFLICGISDAPFFVEFQSAVPQLSGFDVDYCRAVSAAIFNGTDKTVFLPVLASERFQKLASGEVDLLSRITSVTYQRDVNEPTTNKGYTFAQPVFYTGLQFGGHPEYLKYCASDGFSVSPLCNNLTICVNNGTTTSDALLRIFNTSKIEYKSTVHDVIGCLASGDAQVIAGDGFATANYTIHRLLNYTGPYKEDSRLFSRDSFAIVTRQDDPQWSSFVYWVVTATFYAEEQGISQANGASMPPVHLFGESNKFMLQNAVKAVGSYADIYQRNNLGSNYPRLPVNTLNESPFGPQHFPPSGLFGLK